MFSISTNTNGSQVPLSSFPQRLLSKLDVFSKGGKDIRSPLPHLFKSNRTPSDSEIIAIRALITDAEGQIEELHQCFPAHNHAYQVTESRLLKFIEAHKPLLSPIRYLPSEIVQEIFLCYADSRTHPNDSIATMPWCLGHISHRWRQIALSLPSLWDNIPQIQILLAKPKRSYVRAMTCLIRRSGTSPTLKFDMIGYRFSKKMSEGPILNEIMLHSERIEELSIEVNHTTIPVFQRFKRRLPNLRILRVYLNAVGVQSLDIFETAPALRQVRIMGYPTRNFKVLLPWSQITHFEDRLQNQRIGLPSTPLSSLHLLTYLDIDQNVFYFDEPTPLPPYQPTTLPNLRTLKVTHGPSNWTWGEDVCFFLESLTLPALEVMTILCMTPLIPSLLSMISRSHAPSRLQRLAFRTIPLQAGELSALLNLTPHLIELDIDVPPADDLLRLTYGEGEVMLVPMLQALCIRSPMLDEETSQSELFDTLAQVRCELGSRKDSEDVIIPSLGTWTPLHVLRFIFCSTGDRDRSQKILNNWSFSFTPDEAKAIDVLRRCSDCIRGTPFWFEINTLRAEHHMMLHRLLAGIEHFEVTSKVLRETNIHIDLRHIVRALMKLPDQDKYKSIQSQRIIDILAKCDQLLLNDLDGYHWATMSPELCDYSLVYVPKNKFHALRMSPDAGLSIVYGLKLEGRFEEALWDYPR